MLDGLGRAHRKTVNAFSLDRKKAAIARMRQDTILDLTQSEMRKAQLKEGGLQPRGRHSRTEVESQSIRLLKGCDGLGVVARLQLFHADLPQ